MKPTPELIEALKKNEKPLILMEHGLRRAMWGMDLQDFRTPKYNSTPGNVEWVMGSIKHSFDELDDDELNMVYALRADYQPESEIVECEIYDEDEHYHFKDLLGQQHSLSQAFDEVGFVGFKFENGVVSGVPVFYHNSKTNEDCKYITDSTFLRDFEILHATHVLFKK
jgi:hypothetical protein